MNWGYSFVFFWLTSCRISTEILLISKSGHPNTHILTESYKIQPDTEIQKKSSNYHYQSKICESPFLRLNYLEPLAQMQ